ncbi:MAG: hypothetical protein K2X76_07625 [Sphingomonas sp.]|nr:hypothetical protein [Sphingomonas sp.]
MTLIGIYLLIGIIAAYCRWHDIMAEASIAGAPVATAAQFVITWPAWALRSR